MDVFILCDKYYDSFVECRWNIWLWRTIPIVQLVFGTFGNIMNITILLRKRLRKYPTTVYLICLAVSDFNCLWTSLLLGLLGGFGINLWADSHFFCKMSDFLGYSFGSFSIWLLVFITFERVMLIRYPVLSRLKLTRKFAVITALSCLIVTAGLHCHLPYCLGIIHVTFDTENGTVTQSVCAIINANCEAFFNNTFLVTHAFLFTVLPVSLIILANGVIIASLFLQQKRFCTVNPVSRVHMNNTEKKTKSSTKIIILMSAFFVVTRFPYSLKKAFDSENPANDKEIIQSFLLDSVLVLVIYCNMTFNFLIYCLSGSIFNEELRAFVGECKARIYKLLPDVRVTGNIASSGNVTVSATNGTLSTVC